MATSNSVDFTRTRNQLIQEAFDLLGVSGRGKTLENEDLAAGVVAFNKMIKFWGTKGLHLWARGEAVLYLTPYYEEYKLANGASYAKCANTTDQIITRLNGSLALSGTAVTVDSTTGMTTGDNIGVVLDDKTIHWTTLTVNTSTTLTLATGVPSAAADNNLVYTFTDRINKPLRILSARRVTGYDSRNSSADLIETDITIISRDDYDRLPNKTVSGSPTQIMHLPERVYTTVKLWPRPNDGNERIVFTYERILEDMDNVNDEVDFPQEWLEPITWQLAVRLGPPYGKGQKVAQEIGPIASQMLQELLDWDSEITSVRFVPNLEY